MEDRLYDVWKAVKAWPYSGNQVKVETANQVKVETANQRMEQVQFLAAAAHCKERRLWQQPTVSGLPRALKSPTRRDA